MTQIDISEEALIKESQELLSVLLKDRTTKKSIVWATHSYELLGRGFGIADSITPKKVTGAFAKLIQPRSEKSKAEQKDRTKVRAEVFTPTWLVKLQNQVVEDEFSTLPLEEYLDIKWLEMTCGEAPYMVSRYDTVTGEEIGLADRMGFVDRKLQRISKEVSNEAEFFNLAVRAYKASYGYEYQGDSLLLARENLLATFEDYYQAAFAKRPTLEQKMEIATIISYNVMQMDGLAKVTPYSATPPKPLQLDLFGEVDETTALMEPKKTKLKDWTKNKMIGFERLSSEEIDMKFDVVIGNPPYQSDTKKLLYPDFYLNAREIGNIVDLIFPVGWQEPKNNNGLEKLNTKDVKCDKQVVSINNIHNAFPGLSGVEWTNIILWKRGYDNGLDGKQLVYTNGITPKIERLVTDKSEIPKPTQIEELSKLVVSREDFSSIKTVTTARKPYGLTTDFLKKLSKSELEKIHEESMESTPIKIYTSKKPLYAEVDFEIPRKAPAYDSYKVFLPDAWGNMSPKTSFLGGSYANIIIASPKEICTGTYIESGCFPTFDLAQKHAKYFLTKFFRACLFANKHSIINSTAWSSVPVQDYTEDFWELSISEIDKELVKKYRVPQHIATFIEHNIQERDESFILNYR